MKTRRISLIALLIFAAVITGFTWLMTVQPEHTSSGPTRSQTEPGFPAHPVETAAVHIHGHVPGHGHSHRHSHNQGHGYEYTQSHAHAKEAHHSHLIVDYGFRPDAGHYVRPEPDENGFYWWKGNLHTHTLWSDGDQFPEVITQWYHVHSYHFLALSDHNVLLRGRKWIKPVTNPFAGRAGAMDLYELYRERLGDEWIETREVDGELEVRLKPLNEVRALFEQAVRFIRSIPRRSPSVSM